VYNTLKTAEASLYLMSGESEQQVIDRLFSRDKKSTQAQKILQHAKILLHSLQHKSISEIAEILNTTVNKVNRVLQNYECHPHNSSSHPA